MLLKAVVNINGGQIINHPKRVGGGGGLFFHAGTSGRGGVEAVSDVPLLAPSGQRRQQHQAH